MTARRIILRQSCLLIILRRMSAGVLLTASVTAAELTPLQSSLAGPVTVLEFGPATAAPSFHTTGERFSQLLTLNYDAKAAPGPLQVATLPLDCDGVAAPTNLVQSSNGAKPTLDTAARPAVTILNPEPPVWVVVSALLPSVTTCSGQLWFKIGTQSYQPRAFRVTRAAPVELPVEVSGLQRVSSTPGHNNVTFSIKGPSERELRVTVALFELGRMGGGGDTKQNSNISSWSVVPTEVTIPAGGGLAEFELQLGRLEPGEYIGKLNLAAVGYKAKQHSFSVAVRRGPLLAAFLIFIGAMLALLLKRLSTRVRPRLVVRSAVSKLLTAIFMQRQMNAMDPQESSVLDAIQARISEVLNEAAEPGDSSDDWSEKARARLAAEGTKITAFTHWLNARKLLASITTMEAAKRAGFEKQLSSGRQALSNAAALDVAKVEELSKLPGDIAEEKTVLAQATATVAAAKAASAADATASPPAAEEFRRSHEHVKRANECLANEDYLGYREAYDLAGRAYYSGLVDDILLAPADNGQNLTPAQGAVVASPAQTVLLDKVRTSPDLKSARDAYRSARAAMSLTLPLPQNTLHRTMSLSPLLDADFPDPAVRDQRPLMPVTANTVIEDTTQLTARVRWLDNLVDGVAVLGAAVLGVVLIWEPNAGWGRPTDLIAAFLWGMGLHTVGSSTFEGILGLRTKLS